MNCQCHVLFKLNTWMRRHCINNFSLVTIFFSSRLWLDLLTLLSEWMGSVSLFMCLCTISNYWQIHLGLLRSVNMIYVLYFVLFSFVFHNGWTVTTKQLLKHLKTYFVLSFIVLHVTLSSTIWAGVRTLCVFVCVWCFCKLFVWEL